MYAVELLFIQSALCTCNNPFCTYFTAFGKAILCLAKIGDELYIEAEPDGVSLSCLNILTTLERSFITACVTRPQPILPFTENWLKY